jgi:hypothetical protein
MIDLSVEAGGRNADLTVPKSPFGLAGREASPWRDEDPDAPQLGWARQDLRLFARGGHVWAWVDGSEASLEAVLQLALQVGGRAHEILWIHGLGAVDDAGRGWLVPGPSGAGKTTIGRVAGFPRVLSDEMVALRLHDGAWRIWGSPFWSRGRRRPLDAGGAPLSVLAVPMKSDRVGIEPAAAAVAAAALLGQVALYEDGDGPRRWALDRAVDAALAARCVSLQFPKGGPWLSEAMVGLAALAACERV